MQPAVYVNLCTEQLFTSLATGVVQTYPLTPARFYGLGLNLAEFVGCMRINDINGTGATVKLIWQYSFDGATWKDGSDVIGDQTAKENYTGAISTNTQLTPYVRVALKVWQATPTVQVWAVVSVWGYYKFRV